MLLWLPVEIDSGLGVAVPKGTPSAHAKVLEQAVLNVIKNPKSGRISNSLSVDPAKFTGPQYRQVLVEGYESMGKSTKAANRRG